MSQLQSDIELVELSIEEANKMVARGEAAMRLSQNADFKELVLSGYFVEEAARLAHVYADPLTPPNDRQFIHMDLTGPASFKRYMREITRVGELAKAELENHFETLDELRAEEYIVTGGDDDQ